MADYLDGRMNLVIKEAVVAEPAKEAAGGTNVPAALLNTPGALAKTLGTLLTTAKEMIIPLAMIPPAAGYLAGAGHSALSAPKQVDKDILRNQEIMDTYRRYIRDLNLQSSQLMGKNPLSEEER